MRCSFLIKDSIVWGDFAHPDGDFIKSLIEMRKRNKALHNGAEGGQIIPIVTTSGSQIVSFARQSGNNKIVALFNLSPTAAYTAILDGPVEGNYIDALTRKPFTLSLGDYVSLAPWSSLILTQNAIDTAE